jgi:DNA polymerase III delta prime subunit
VQGGRLQKAIERDGGLNTASVRVVVINNAEELIGFNADIALKTLEKELGSSLYIFVVNDETRFSAALRSRCSVYRVGPIPMDDLLAGLSGVCTERCVTFDKGAIRAIAVAAAGSFGDAVTIMSRVEAHGDVSMENLLRIPEFSWGLTMLACWQAFLENRLDEAVSLFERIGSDGPMRIRAMQAFLAECRIRYKMVAASVSPALDCIQSNDWTAILASWTAWCRDRAVEPDEALEQLLNFWATVRTVTSSRVAFFKGCEVLASGRH